MKNTIIMTGFLFLLSPSVYAEANIDAIHTEKSFLLTAPGTVTGNKNQAQKSKESVVPTLPAQNPPQGYPQRRYKYVGESSKFRQFGQEQGQNNPWFEGQNTLYPRLMSPMPHLPLTNPWQLGGMPPMQVLEKSQYDSYSFDPSSAYQPEKFSSGNQLFPDFPDGIYRDTNPATFYLPRKNNSIMPGFGGDNFGFPFSPFGMF